VLGIGGIEVKTGVTVGESVTFEQLEKDHDAVFIGFGPRPRHLARRPGRQAARVVRRRRLDRADEARQGPDSTA
jgi:NADPH-dependent glutamate synthase beta subunit-like oxidoreductase